MKIHPDCRPCLIKQMETTARAAGADEETVREVARQAALELERVWDSHLSPPAVSAPLYQFTGRLCGAEDPFLAVKVRYTHEALKLLPELERMVGEASDPFDAAVRVSIAGNVIDFGTGEHGETIDLDRTLSSFMEKSFYIDDSAALKEEVSGARTVLYIGDNAGETVFDRPLLKMLSGSEVVYAAREGAIINDANVRDATLAGVHLHARLLSSGSEAPGVILEECSASFKDVYERSDVIISKGQGNFETLTENPPDGRTFMLFTVKCPVAADHLGAGVGDMIVMKW